jgi:hypothetical protein
MPTIRVNASVPANGVAFPLAGNQYEYLPFPARVQFAIVSINTTPGAITATVYSGSDVLQQDSPVTEKAAVATNAQEDFLIEDVAAAGERISVNLRNSSAGALATQTTVVITPLV